MDSTTRTYRIAVLPGDGIGPEVTDEAVRVLRAVAVRFGFDVSFLRFPIGGEALDQGLDVLPDSTLEGCRSADAVFLGAVGGPRWDMVDVDQRPEKGLLRLRRELGLFANLRPVVVPDSLIDASPLRREIVEGVDLLVVRELTGGIYFGPERSSRSAGELVQASSTMVYSRGEVERVARTAFGLARTRRGLVTSVDKANVLAVSRLWREAVSDVHQREFPDVGLEHLYVDNAAMQLVQSPRRFDVILTGNLFGDILSDLAASIPGSLGVLPSASVGGRAGLFEPVHGSAPEIAGSGIANPVAAILSAAMMLEHLGENEAGAIVRGAVDKVLTLGLLTADLAAPGSASITTVEFGAAVAGEITAADGSRNGHSKQQTHELPS